MSRSSVLLTLMMACCLVGTSVAQMVELQPKYTRFAIEEMSGRIAPEIDSRYQPTCDICMEPEIAYDIGRTQVRLIAGRIHSNRASGTSGRLSLELWAHREPITGGTVSYFPLARYDLGTLPAGTGYRDVDVLAPYLGDPDDGCYYISMAIVEDSSGYRDWATFSGCVIINGREVGTCCGTPSVTPTPEPSVTPLPGTNPGTVLGTLDDGFWVSGNVAGVFDPAKVEDTADGFSLSIEGDPSSTFGYWQTRQAMDPMAAGTYRLAVKLRRIGDVAPSQSYPEVRIRVFPENALRQQFSTAAESGNVTIPGEIVLYFDHNGTDRWRVAVDLMGFRADYAGGIEVTDMFLTRVN